MTKAWEHLSCECIWWTWGGHGGGGSALLHTEWLREFLKCEIEYCQSHECLESCLSLGRSMMNSARYFEHSPPPTSSTSHPLDVIHVIGVPRPYTYYTELNNKQNKQAKKKKARLGARPGSIYLISDVNTNINVVGERGLSKLEAFLCSAYPSDYETKKLTAQYSGEWCFLFVGLFVCFILFCFVSGKVRVSSLCLYLIWRQSETRGTAVIFTFHAHTRTHTHTYLYQCMEEMAQMC